MWKGAWIKHPVALHTAWGGMRKALRGQDSARKGSATPEWHVGGVNGVSRALDYRAGRAGGSADPLYRYRYPSRGWEALTQPPVNMHFG